MSNFEVVVGTLGHLNLKQGDVVECVEKYCKDSPWTIGKQYTCPKDGELNADIEPPQASSISVFKIVSRKSDMGDKTKTWGEMSPEEKGALLLAHHEGKTIQWIDPKDKEDKWDSFSTAYWLPYCCYRVKPEPKIEEVRVYSEEPFKFWSPHKLFTNTHEITFNIVDGEPDCNSVKMREL